MFEVQIGSSRTEEFHIHLGRAEPERRRLRVILDEMEQHSLPLLSTLFFSSASPFHHSSATAQGKADDPAAASVCVLVKCESYRTNSLSETWQTGSMLTALPRNVLYIYVSSTTEH